MRRLPRVQAETVFLPDGYGAGLSRITDSCISAATILPMDPIAFQINEALRRWGDRMPNPLPPEPQLAAEWEWVRGLLKTNPPANQVGPLTTARDRIAQARRMLIPHAVTGF